MKSILNSKYGEAGGYLAVLVPVFAFLLYIKAISWIGVGAMTAAVAATAGGYLALSALFACGARIFRLRGKPATVFLGGWVAAGAGIAKLLWLEAHDTLVICGMGLALVCVLLAFGRRQSAGDA